MKTWILLLSLLGSFAWPAAGDQGANVIPTLPKTAQDQLAWLHAGLRRGEVERRFKMDGGLIFQPTFRYYVRDVIVSSKLVMVDLIFQPDGMSDAVFKDAKLRGEWFRVHPKYIGMDSPKDILRDIGSAYLSGGAID